MSILQNVQSFLYRRALRNKRREQQERKQGGKRPVTLATAKRIGIVFDATELPVREQVLAFAKKLKQDNKKVRLLGQFRTDVGEADFPFPYFSKKQVAWAGYPQGSEVDHFLAQDYDVLLVLQPQSNRVMEYLATLTNAQLKVGPVSDSPDAYDLMLDTAADATVRKFIIQLEKILEKTNVPQPVAV